MTVPNKTKGCTRPNSLSDLSISNINAGHGNSTRCNLDFQAKKLSKNVAPGPDMLTPISEMPRRFSNTHTARQATPHNHDRNSPNNTTIPRIMDSLPHPDPSTAVDLHSFILPNNIAPSHAMEYTPKLRYDHPKNEKHKPKQAQTSSIPFLTSYDTGLSRPRSSSTKPDEVSLWPRRPILAELVFCWPTESTTRCSTVCALSTWPVRQCRAIAGAVKSSGSCSNLPWTLQDACV